MNSIRPISVLSRSTTRFSALTDSQTTDLKRLHKQNVKDAVLEARLRQHNIIVMTKTPIELVPQLEVIAKAQSKRAQRLADNSETKAVDSLKFNQKLEREIQLEGQLLADVEKHIISKIKRHGHNFVDTHICYRSKQDSVTDLKSYILEIQRKIAALPTYVPSEKFWQELMQLAKAPQARIDGMSYLKDGFTDDTKIAESLMERASTPSRIFSFTRLNFPGWSPTWEKIRQLDFSLGKPTIKTQYEEDFSIPMPESSVGSPLEVAEFVTTFEDFRKKSDK